VELRWRAFRAVPWVWVSWERFYLRLHPLTPVRPGSLFAFRRRGAVLELHLDGRALATMRRGDGYSTFRTVHELRDELAALADRFRMGELSGVRVIQGTSLIGEAGAVLGFETRPLPRTVGNRLQRYFMVGLDAVYHPGGLRERAKRRWPVEVTMTVGSLLERYPETADRRLNRLRR
jgi:YkoP-like protein